jgi:Right handed beta helix region/Secretion system C-terminal sorting domain
MKSLYLILLLLLIPLTSQATSWLVMQDGTGDYTDIQAAVDGCAVGDTVLVGPGRYETFHTHWPDLNWTEIVGVTVDSLTIKALYRNTAIIGPEVVDEIEVEKDSEKVVTTIGIATLGGSWLVIEDLVFENTHRGINLNPSGVVRSCSFDKIFDYGVIVGKGYDVLIEDCVSHGCGRAFDLYMYQYDGRPVEAIVRNCTSYDDYIGFTSSHPNSTFIGCRSFRSRGGFDFNTGNGSMIKCSIINGNRSITVSDFGTLTMTDCVIQGSYYNDIYVNTGYLYGSGNILYGGCTSDTILIPNGSARFKGNRIDPSSGFTINVDYHLNPGVEIDFTDNYWGTSDSDSITAWIWDGVDQPSLGVTVDYLPFRAEPTAGVDERDTPLAPSILEIYPNPFNPSTKIRFNLTEAQHTKVAVYDVSGRLIKTLLDEFTFGGEQTIDWNGRDATGRAVSSGSYFVRLQGDRVSEVRKVMLLR